jgi:hypothetical protein
MAANTGLYDISSLLAVRFQSVAEFGMDTIAEVLQRDLAAHNVIVSELVTSLATPTSDRQRIYGSSASGDMIEVDEYGRGPTQRQLVGATCGFPLKLYQYALGWTRKWMQVKTPADLAEAVIHAQKSHIIAIRREIKKAVYLSTNYTFNDFLIDKVDLAVKRLVNADSAAIPDGPNGEIFDPATHSHYNGSAALDVAAANALINDVVEHGHGGAVKIAINTANEAAWRALTGFTAYVDPRIIFRATDTPGQTLDITRLDNRAIGIFGAAEIWVKPWAIANYAFCWDEAEANKPLVYRQRESGVLQGLRIAAELDTYPLFAQYMEAEYGFGAWTRTNGAVLYHANATYADPTIT